MSSPFPRPASGTKSDLREDLKTSSSSTWGCHSRGSCCWYDISSRINGRWLCSSDSSPPWTPHQVLAIFTALCRVLGTQRPALSDVWRSQFSFFWKHLLIYAETPWLLSVFYLLKFPSPLGLVSTSESSPLPIPLRKPLCCLKNDGGRERHALHKISLAKEGAGRVGAIKNMG